MGDESILKAIEAINVRLASLDKLEAIDARTITMNESILKIHTEMAQMRQTCADNKKELKTDLALLRGEVKALTSRLDKAENTIKFHDMEIAHSNEVESMGLSLTINGIPKKDNEVLNDIFGDLAKKVGFARPPRVHLFRYADTSPAPTIVARFHSEIDKNDFKFNYMKIAKTFTVRKLAGFNNAPADARIYIQDQMSKATYELHKTALQCKKNNRLSHVMVEKCKVVVKFTPNGPKHRLFNTAHLNKLLDQQEKN